MFAKAVAALALALFAHSALAQDCIREYTVKSGDYCDSISAAQSVSTFQLAAVNSALIDERCGNLVPGGTLCLGRQGEDCTDVYVVKPNDSCETIAAAHNTNTTILRLNNPQINDHCDNIYIGEVLCVASTVTVPPIPAGGVVVPVAGPPANSDAPPIPTTTVVGTPTAAPTPRVSATAAPAPAPVADDDDTDCDDDDDSSKDAPAGGATTPAPTQTSAPAPPTDDDDDANLPYCDEL
jgi:LysM repeat protein